MIEYDKNKPLRVATAFSGYDSQKMALERLHRVFPDFCYEMVAWSEIEKNAICAHNSVFPEDKTKNLGDISKVDWTKVADFDLFTYSFPCQDISAAGNQKGFEEGSGTRSSLLWECKKAIEAKKPRFLMMENVKALASVKFLPFLRKWQGWLHRQGYENFTQILNATDYEVPQNRERVFMVSILRTDDNPYPIFHFPRKMILEKRLKHVLEQNVDESYYLSQKMLEYFCRASNDKSHCHKLTPKDGEDIAFTINCASGQRVDDNFIKLINTDLYGNVKPIVARYGQRGKKCLLRDDSFGITGVAEEVESDLSTSTKDNMLAEPALMAVNGCLIDEYGRAWRIRKLTPTECFRLMDVEDKDIEKMKQAGIKKTNLYKLAGNSIVVSCMFHLFRKLFIEKGSESDQLELF